MSSIVNPKAFQQSTIQFGFQQVNGTLKPKGDEKCEIAFFNGLNNAETTGTISPFSTSTGVTIQYNSSNVLCSLRALCDAGRLLAALTMLESMEFQGIKVNSDSYVPLLQACTRMKAVKEGMQVHAHIIKTKFNLTIFLANTLINMYAKCGKIDEARQVFDNMLQRNVFTWTTMISGYCQVEADQLAINCFEQMQQMGFQPNEVTYASILCACANLEALQLGKLIHAHIRKAGLQSDVFICSTLIAMYVKSGNFEYAHQVFDTMPNRNVVLWTAMISGYAQNKTGVEAVTLFKQMKHDGIKPNKYTYVSIVTACSHSGSLSLGKCLHAHLRKGRLELDIFVGSSLVGMYAKWGCMEDASRLFQEMPTRDIVSWNAMILGYMEHGNGVKATEHLCQMQLHGLKPDKVTYIGVLSACSSTRLFSWGKHMHTHLLKAGVEMDIFVGSTLVSMYVKCGSMGNACQAFDRTHTQDIVSWNMIISGFAQEGDGGEAIRLFKQMHQHGLKADNITYLSVLHACAKLGILGFGKDMHLHLILNSLESDAYINSALIDMYSKCGSIADACNIFNTIPIRDVISWNAMISGYAEHGDRKEVLKLFIQMQEDGLKPDKVTFISILGACSHMGLIDEGWCYFSCMSWYERKFEHYICMVDLLGRTGSLYEAKDFIEMVPIKFDLVVWVAFLGACRSHGNLELAECAVEEIFRLEPLNGAAYVLLANVYARIND